MNNLLHSIEEVPKDKKLIVFDLDGTLTESKTDMDEEMSELLMQLLQSKKVAVIGGGKYSLFQRQLIDKLKTAGGLLNNLFLFPTTATAFYKYDGKDWQKIYSKEFTKEEKEKIFSAFDKTFKELNYNHPEKVYGELVEDRGNQVTFSFLGQEAPLKLKEKFKKEQTDLKLKIAETLQKNLPEMEVRAAGYTSIDVTHKGIDKEFGIQQISEHLGITLENMIFVGDALFPGGNDSAVLRTGIPCVEVKNVEETKKLVQYLTG